MKIIKAKTKIMCFSRHPVQCSFKTNGVTLQLTEKFKYFGVTFSSDGRQDKELDTRIGKITAVMRPVSGTETIAVYKSKPFCFQISFCSNSHLWSRVLSIDRKSEIPSTGGRNEFFAKSQRFILTGQG